MWRPASVSEKNFADNLAKRLDVDPVIALRLLKYELDEATARKFLHPSREDIRALEQVLMGLPVTEWVQQWRNELVTSRVAVFSDYDVDGNSSAEIVKQALDHHQTETLFGSARVEDGFGLSARFVEEAAAWGAQWLITVDCGSTQSAEIAAAQAHGMRCIVIDHHDIDMDNPADMHCNPQYARARAVVSLKDWLNRTEALLTKIGSARARQKSGNAVDLSIYAQPATELLTEAANYGVVETKLQHASRVIAQQLLPALSRPDTLTGSAMTWMWGKTLWEEEQSWWWEEPLYFAGLGLIADMGSMLVLENRAMARLAAEHVPIGIKQLADHLGETPERPSSLIRTRAALNLAKRTSRVSGDQIAEVYVGDAFATAKLAAEYVQTARRKDVMLEHARTQIDDADTWATAQLDDWPADAGQSGVIANKIARETGRPAVIFALRDDGNYKFSARNGKRNRNKIGELLSYPPLLEAAQTHRDGVWETSLGGHEDVVSGACAPERISDVLAAMNSWLQPLKTLKTYDTIWINERLVTPERIGRLVQEVGLLEPLGNDSWGVEVSAIARLTNIDDLDNTATLVLQDESQYDCDLAPEALEAGEDWQEWKIRVNQGRWWLKEWLPVEESSAS